MTKKKEHSEKDCSLKGPDDSRMGNDVSVKAKGTSELFSFGTEKDEKGVKGRERKNDEGKRVEKEKYLCCSGWATVGKKTDRTDRNHAGIRQHPSMHY